ncbi:MAG: hypothetical protein VX446_01020 [Bacteroidota bacterium]|nr:hypothetical protein [Bacteroidota bacterium]
MSHERRHEPMTVVLSIKATHHIHVDFVGAYMQEPGDAVVTDRKGHKAMFIYGRMARDRATGSTFYFNTEQLCRPGIGPSTRIRFIKTGTAEKPHIYCDYSRENLKLLRAAAEAEGHGPLPEHQLVWLPIPYNPKEIEPLRLLVSERPTAFEFDVAVIGGSSHRTNVVERLKECGVRVLRVNGWGMKRDANVPKAKVLLNVHLQPESNIYEAARCDRWVFAGMPVLSEACRGQSDLDVADVVTFAERPDKECLVDMVKRVVQHWDTWQPAFLERWRKSMPALQKSRQTTYEIFRDRYDAAVRGGT